MAAINPEALSKFTGILQIAPQATPAVLTRIASVRGLIANVDTAANQVEVKADDTGTVFKGYTPDATIEGTFLENADRDLMLLLLGGTESDVAGAPVAGATQVIASPFIANNFYLIENQEGDGSAPTINSVTGGTDGALTEDDDWFLVLNPSTGNYGITLNTVAGGTNITTLAQTITIDYDYTPNASEDLSIPVQFTEASRLFVRITATDDATGNTRIIELDDASYEGVYGLEFLDVVEAGDLTGTSFSFKANDGSTLVIENEIL